MDINTLTKIINESIDINNEICCMSLTSKNEGLIVNEVVKYISKNCNDFIPVKEYNRVDLALLDKKFIEMGEIKTTDIIEFKSCYTFDVFCENKYKIYQQILYNDFEKEKNINILEKDPNINQYNVLIITDPRNKIPKYLYSIIKYSRDINKYFDNVEENINKISDKIRNIFPLDKFDLREVKFKNCNRANFLGIEMDLYVYIIKKYR